MILGTAKGWSLNEIVNILQGGAFITAESWVVELNRDNFTMLEEAAVLHFTVGAAYMSC